MTETEKELAMTEGQAHVMKMLGMDGKKSGGYLRDLGATWPTIHSLVEREFFDAEYFSMRMSLSEAVLTMTPLGKRALEAWNRRAS